MKRRGYTEEDANYWIGWAGWRATFITAILIVMMVIYSLVMVFAAIMSLAEGRGANWGWWTNLLAFLTMIVFTFLLSWRPDPLVHLCLRVFCGPHRP